MYKVLKITLLIFGLSLLAGCQQNDLSDIMDDNMTKEQMIKEVTPVIQSFLDAQYRYALGKDATPQWDEYITAGSAELQERINIGNQNLKKINSYYVDYSSQIKLDDANIYSGENGVWHLDRVIDVYYLPLYDSGLKDSDDNIVHTRGHYPYNFTVKKVNGKWMIIEWEEKEEFIDFNGRWYVHDPEEANKINSSYGIEKRRTSKESTKSSVGYDRNAAAQYALNHWNNPSSNYPNYAAHGGDCTNFVSQCLEAGGWTQTSMSIPRASEKAWYHKRGSSMPSTNYRSVSWTSAVGLSNFLGYTDRVIPASYTLSSYEKGDIVQILSSTVSHSMIITRVGTNKVYVTYRSVTNGENSDVAISTKNGYTFWKLKD